MIEYGFAREDLLRTRFALSPLFELMSSVEVLRDPGRHSMHLPWARQARARLEGLDFAMLDALVPARSYCPDFVAPPPASPLPDVAAEIERVRTTPPERVALEIGWTYPAPGSLPPVLAPLLARPAEGLERLADLLAAYWERALAPVWDHVRATLEADILARARRQSLGGPLAVLEDLHPDVAWADGALRIEHRHAERVELGGRGLLLVPSAFSWPGVRCMLDPPWQPALIYPPRGVAALWAPEPGDAADSEALAALLGRRRARVLAGLDEPVSTTALARRLGASPAGISEHLGVLRRAGLVRAARDGRAVLYARTPLGEALTASRR
ncbi:MAG TPA: DUF5937 family protein [Solirubrobacteraceae bacterium]